ncbi:MAG: peptide chain release factor 2 [Candidatus Latescibacteria bacterium]|nr:peptide chain release factor 2 [Candidatus Latescibacterota bacterium]
MITVTELRTILEECQTRLTDLRGYFDLEAKERVIAALEQEMAEAGFWGNPERAQTVGKDISSLKKVIERWRALNQQMDDLMTLATLAEEEEDAETVAEVERAIGPLRREIDALELQSLLSGPDDANNAILSIHPGAGGTESQDWAQMLMRMYLRWIEMHGYASDVLDLQPGEEAGIKSVDIEVTGPYAYGYLKAEAGVHRLVRISPYDANHRRHTSFASVSVLPEIEDPGDIALNEADLKIDTFRASGAGGQHVNKTSSAVRITHLPTGIVVQCQSERSQHRNRESAMKLLMAKLYQLQHEELRKKVEAMEAQKKEIAWGSQIRSYVFHPYTLVKDHRTGEEAGNIQAVMDGEIDRFIRAFLSQNRDGKPAV